VCREDWSAKGFSMRTQTRSRSILLRPLSPLRDFLRTESAGGILLVAATVVALLWANLLDSYDRFWDTPAVVSLDDHALELTLRYVVNDALMAIFFLVVGLEIKRELTTGHLAGRRQATLPVLAAAGGMVVPALVYLAIAGTTAADGWAVPVATDIALAVGVLALAGAAVTPPMRAFLLGLAIVDDIGAILIIALVFSSGLSWGWMATATAAVLAVIGLQRAGVRSMPVFVAVGAVLWLGLHEAGVHATLAGVILGLLTPVEPRLTPELVDVEELLDISTVEAARTTTDLARSTVSQVEWLQHVLHPWTSFVIVPVFALANAGVSLSVDTLSDTLSSPIAWGIAAGLLLGKPIGVLLAVRLAQRAGVADGIPGADLRRQLGIGQAAGIGFTVSLFISELAFDDPAQQSIAKTAVLLASVLAGITALLVLRSGSRQRASL
jgi:NhaA family Na+:H+ antiporter